MGWILWLISDNLVQNIWVQKIQIQKIWVQKIWVRKIGPINWSKIFELKKFGSKKFWSKKEAIWIALVGLFVHVDIKYWDFLTLEGTFITPTFRVGVMKVPSVSLISPYFMVKIRFCHFLSLFVPLPTIIWIALVGLFVHVGYMKPTVFYRLQDLPS